MNTGRSACRTRARHTSERVFSVSYVGKTASPSLYISIPLGVGPELCELPRTPSTRSSQHVPSAHSRECLSEPRRTEGAGTCTMGQEAPSPMREKPMRRARGGCLKTRRSGAPGPPGKSTLAPLENSRIGWMAHLLQAAHERWRTGAMQTSQNLPSPTLTD
jgi:hypothetical protein